MAFDRTNMAQSSARGLYNMNPQMNNMNPQQYYNQNGSYNSPSSGFADLMGDAGQWFGDFLGGTDQKVTPQATLNPQQMQMQDWLRQTGQQGLGQFNFQNIRNAANTDWEQRGMPSILERLTSSGLDRSSAAPQMLSMGYSDMQKNLSALESKYNATREPMFQERMKMGMQPSFENLVQPGQAPQLMNVIGALISAFTGNPSGMAEQLAKMFSGLGQQGQQGGKTGGNSGFDINNILNQGNQVSKRFDSFSQPQQPRFFGGF